MLDVNINSNNNSKSDNLQENVVSVADKQVWTNNLERTLDRLYKCRDLEITNLWQRSVFLAVFLTLCFTGYGILFSNLFSLANISEVADKTLIHLGAIGIGGLGFTFSVVWIMMAKGSKAWYEVYEGAIDRFEKEFQIDLQIPEMYRMGMGDGVDGGINDKLFSEQAGAYSPSKLNIIIGWICFIVWIIVVFIHFIFIFCNIIDNYYECKESNHLILILLTLVFFFLGFVLYKIANFIIKKIKYYAESSYLGNESRSKRAQNREMANKALKRRNQDRENKDIYYFNIEKH